jgi:hypothetical protein
METLCELIEKLEKKLELMEQVFESQNTLVKERELLEDVNN